MGNNWLAEFGFKKSPYDTKALSSEEGNKLLVGRDKEMEWLIDQITTASRVPILKGDNGVGKTSIANIAAYRMSKQTQNCNQRYFVLQLNQIISTQLTDLKAFEENLYYEVIHLLLDEKPFLRARGINAIEIFSIQLLLRALFIPGIGIGPASLEPNPNSIGKSLFTRIAQKWLKKCFCEPYSGGIICIIDNLEINGTSAQVQEIVENMRDTLFSVSGLLWILCGTPVVVKGISTSKRLEGYLTYRTIDPIGERAALELVKRRIQYFGTENSNPPVNQELFQFIYKTVTNSQLRIALKLCEDFAEHLYYNPRRQTEDRLAELKLWLHQRAAARPNQLNNLSEKTWKIFDSIAEFGGSVLSTDYCFFSLTNAEELNQLVSPLLDHLLECSATDCGYLFRITEIGWLVNYQRRHS